MSTKNLITDLAKLKAAIKKARVIVVELWEFHGGIVCLPRVTKQEALRMTVIQGKLDDYAAKVDGDYLILNHEKVEGLRVARLPLRKAARYKEACSERDYFLALGSEVPAWVTSLLTENQPAEQAAA